MFPQKIGVDWQIFLQINLEEQRERERDFNNAAGRKHRFNNEKNI